MRRRKGDDELAVVENRFENSALLDDHILDFGNINGVTVPIKKQRLIELNDAEIRNNENLKVEIKYSKEKTVSVKGHAYEGNSGDNPVSQRTHERGQGL